jgi:histone H3/H4
MKTKRNAHVDDKMVSGKYRVIRISTAAVDALEKVSEEFGLSVCSLASRAALAMTAKWEKDGKVEFSLRGGRA